MDSRQAWLLIEGFIAAPFAAALAWIFISAVAGTGSSDPTALFTAMVLLYLFSAPVIVAVVCRLWRWHIGFDGFAGGCDDHGNGKWSPLSGHLQFR